MLEGFQRFQHVDFALRQACTEHSRSASQLITPLNIKNLPIFYINKLAK